MTQITISLDDESVQQLQNLARRRGDTIEQTAQSLVSSALPLSSPTALSSVMASLSPDDPDGSKAIKTMAGTVHYPSVTGKVRTTNEEIDRRIAEEAMNSHDE